MSEKRTHRPADGSAIGGYLVDGLVRNVREEKIPLFVDADVTDLVEENGLSLGITDDLTTVGKLMIALLMFIGRIGMLYTLMIFVPKETRDLGYEYPSEKIIIG